MTGGRPGRRGLPQGECSPPTRASGPTPGPPRGGGTAAGRGAAPPASPPAPPAWAEPARRRRPPVNWIKSPAEGAGRGEPRRSCPAATGVPTAQPGPPRRELLEAGREPPRPAAEIGGGPGPLPAQVAAARRPHRCGEPRRLRGKQRGHLCRSCGSASPGPGAPRLPGLLSDLFPVGCRGSRRQSPAPSRRPAAGSAAREALAAAREKFPHGKGVGGGGGARPGAACG